MLWLTVTKYVAIDGGQRAASFAYYAFFALFPLLLLLVAIGSYFFNPARAGTLVLDTVSHYVLVNSDKDDLVTKTIRGVIKTRRGVGSFAVLGLVWSSLRFFQSLVIGVNRAWGTHEYSWWRLPAKTLLMVAILVSALPVGLLAPFVLRSVETLIWRLDIPYGAKMIVFGFQLARFLFPSALLFYGLSMFYMLAPRRRTTFREMWVGALAATLLLQALQSLFLLYAKNVVNFGAVYGAFGSVIAVLIWVYLSGSVIILGGCFCAARAEVGSEIRNPKSEIRKDGGWANQEIGGPGAGDAGKE
jgi:YihY family inner membrane protein